MLHRCDSVLHYFIGIQMNNFFHKTFQETGPVERHPFEANILWAMGKSDFFCGEGAQSLDIGYTRDFMSTVLMKVCNSYEGVRS